MSHLHRKMHAYREQDSGRSCMIIASLIIIQLLQLFVDGDDILRSMQEELIGNFANQF